MAADLELNALEDVTQTILEFYDSMIFSYCRRKGRGNMQMSIVASEKMSRDCFTAAAAASLFSAFPLFIF